VRRSQFWGPPLFLDASKEVKRMRMISMLLILMLSSPLLSSSADAKTTRDGKVAVPPVYAGDVERPYRIIGEIRDNLRKHFAFQESPTEEKIYAEIWERARKLGADAVINARYGATERTMFNHGRTPISGTAIKFTDAAVERR
jgi:hypothetical protein